MSGNCSGALTPVYGLVQITPDGDGLTWKSQEPAPYRLSGAGPNAWQYSGPTAVGDGTLTLSVKFTSSTTLEMTRTFAPSAEPGCTHTHFYTGTFQWFS